VHDLHAADGSIEGQQPPEPVLQIRNLRIEFPMSAGIFAAVDDVSFSLARGRTTCLVGESGSGKTVASRAVMRLIDKPGRIAAGEIVFSPIKPGRVRALGDTIDLAAQPADGALIRAVRGRHIAMIFQEPMSSLSPVHTVGRQMTEMLQLHRTLTRKQARDEAIALLARVEIPDPQTAIDRYSFEFSGGMRQRVMIAMALSCEPEILIADEPTTALDVTTQAEILSLIKRLQTDQGMAVLFITHDMGVVAEIADDVVVMRHGRVVEQGPVTDIFDHPRDAYTKALLASFQKLGGEPSGRVRRNAADHAAPIIDVRKLSKTFVTTSGFFGTGQKRVVEALKDIDLSIAEGDSLGVVGESGSGKTTLGRCLMRIVDPSSGQALYRGRDGRTVDLAAGPRKRMRYVHSEMRMIFQDPFSSLNPRLTVRQLIGEPLLVRGSLAGEELTAKVKGLMQQVGLDPGSIDRYPHAFSGGQRQRIVIARALALDPRVIIADEATSALDVSLRSQVLDLLLDMKDHLGLTVIMISHDIGVIRYFCNRIVVMFKGAIVEAGDTEDVITSPRHEYTQSLLSAVPSLNPRDRGLVNRFRYVG